MLNLLMNFKSLLLLTSLILFIGCETIKNKTDEIAKKENEFLSNFIGKESSELKSNLGIPTEDFIGGTGQNILIYKTNIMHGVKEIDPSKKLSLDSINGRVVLMNSLYQNYSKFKPKDKYFKNKI